MRRAIVEDVLARLTKSPDLMQDDASLHRSGQAGALIRRAGVDVNAAAQGQPAMTGAAGLGGTIEGELRHCRLTRE